MLQSLRASYGRVALFFLLLAVLAVPVAAQDVKVRIAIMNFENNSSWHWWGDNLGAAAADELTTQLVQTCKLTVVERAQLDALLAEQNLGASGRATAASAAEIGRLLGVQVILTGSITQFSIERKSIGFRGIGGSYANAETKLDVRLINVETGEILSVAEGDGDKRMGGGYFMGASAEQTFDQGAAQEALRPAVEGAVAQVAAQAETLASIQPPAPVSQIVGVRNDSYYINR